ncbi:MAG TPA: hypothetical protein VF810_00175, partial [Patescibacteria group bacterium]
MEKKSGSSRRELFTGLRGQRVPKSPEVTLSPVYPNADDELSIGRRGFLKTTGWTALGLLADNIGVDVWGELVPDKSAVKFFAGQKERLKKGETDSLCLVFGGDTVRTPDQLAMPILGDLSNFGAVAQVDYANDGFDVKNIAQEIIKLQKDNPNLKKLSVYGQSLGPMVAGLVFEELRKRECQIELDYLVMDSTPTSLADTRYPFASPVIDVLDGKGGCALFTAGANTLVYGNPFQPGSAPPLLFDAEADILETGKSALEFLASVAKEHGSHVAMFRVEDASKDNVIDPVKAQA